MITNKLVYGTVEWVWFVVVDWPRSIEHVYQTMMKIDLVHKTTPINIVSLSYRVIILPIAQDSANPAILLPTITIS